ncbi:MAG: S8 family serine peptidase, partial [Gemmatimonadota bacterium]|nr:S8 family serine peptidase [Gemmatimonadota bacterium]
MLLATPLVCLALATCRDTLGPTPPRLGPRPGALVAVEDTLVASGDTHISKSSPNQNFGTNGEMRVGGTSRYRALVQFDSAAIRQAVGSGRLDSARVEFTIIANPDGFGSGGRQVDLHRLTRSWTELGATWNCPVDANTANTVPDCPGTAWDMTNTGQAPYVTTRTARVTITNGQTGVIRLDVSADVAGFLAGTVHQGWLFRKYNESEHGQALVLSRAVATGPPRLILAVTVNPVPAQAPDSVPLSVQSELRDQSRWIRGHPQLGGAWPRAFVTVMFQSSASQSARQAAVDAVQGVVVGGWGVAGGDGTYLLRIPDDGTAAPVLSALAVLDTMPGVSAAAQVGFTTSQYRKPVDGPSWGKLSWTPIPDSAAGQNWSLEAIAAPLGWACSIGSPSAVVAVVDVGFFATPDLAKNTDPAFVGVLGSSANAGDGHGASVAALIGAQGNDTAGITGVMWDVAMRYYVPSVTFLDQTTIEVANGIAAAATGGSRIVNVSLGVNWLDTSVVGWVPTSADSGAVERLYRAFKVHLISRVAQLPLIVIAAGNDNVDASYQIYPLLARDFPQTTIVVQASDSLGVRWIETTTSPGYRAPQGSGFGQLVELDAPGHGITTYAASQGVAGLYSGLAGTSLAAPLVTGTAGLLATLDPSLTPSEIKSLLLV